MNYKYLLFATLILTSCRGVQYLARQAAPGATYAETIDTKSKPITFQPKKYTIHLLGSVQPINLTGHGYVTL